jgi:hypothetical protein
MSTPRHNPETTTTLAFRVLSEGLASDYASAVAYALGQLDYVAGYPSDADSWSLDYVRESYIA